MGLGLLIALAPWCRVLASPSSSLPLILGFQCALPQFGYSIEKQKESPVLSESGRSAMAEEAASSLLPFLGHTDGEVSGRVLAGGAAGMLAGRHHPLEHFPGHLPLPNGRGHQSVLPHHHPSTGMSPAGVSGVPGRGHGSHGETGSRRGFAERGRQETAASCGTKQAHRARGWQREERPLGTEI